MVFWFEQSVFYPKYKGENKILCRRYVPYSTGEDREGKSSLDPNYGAVDRRLQQSCRRPIPLFRAIYRQILESMQKSKQWHWKKRTVHRNEEINRWYCKYCPSKWRNQYSGIASIVHWDEEINTVVLQVLSIEMKKSIQWYCKYSTVHRNADQYNALLRTVHQDEFSWK